MAGYQFGFTFSSDSDIKEEVFNTVIDRLDNSFYAYELKRKDIIYIQISFRQMDKKLRSEFLLNKPCHVSRNENI